MYAGKLLFMDGGNLFIFEWLAMASIFHSLYIVISPAVGEYGEIMAVPAWHYQLILLDLFFPPPTQLSAAPIYTNLPATLRHKRQLPHDKSTWMIVYSWSRTVIFVAFLLPFSLSSARSDGFIKSLCCFTVNMGH